MISQCENYHLRDLVYPFARLECEGPAARRLRSVHLYPEVHALRLGPAEQEALEERILDCLAEHDEPMSRADICAALEMTTPADEVRVKNTLYKLSKDRLTRPAGRSRQKPARGSPPNLWVLA